MKRKIILALMTICTLSFVSCGKQEATATTESIPNAVESAQVELTETTTETIESTEVVEDNTSEAETKDESTRGRKDHRSNQHRRSRATFRKRPCI